MITRNFSLQSWQVKYSAVSCYDPKFVGAMVGESVAKRLSRADHMEQNYWDEVIVVDDPY